MPTTKTMLGIGACAIAVVALCRRALRTPTPRDGRPQVTRQNAYRTLPGLRDDPPSYEAATAQPEPPQRPRTATARTLLMLQAVPKQSPNTLLDSFGHYKEGYMTLFDTIWSVKL